MKLIRFTGSRVAKRLDAEYDVILISQNDYFENLPSLPSLVSHPNNHPNIIAKYKRVIVECL